MDSWKTYWNSHCDEIHRHLARAVVRIGYQFARREPTNTGDYVDDWSPNFEYFPGVIVRTGDHLIIATAGHVLAKLNDLAKKYKIIRFEVACELHNDQPLSLLVSPEKFTAKWIDSEVRGFDVGLIFLGRDVQQLILASEAISVNITTISEPSFMPDLFVVLGFPGGLRECAYETHGNMFTTSIRTVVAAVPIRCVKDDSVARGKIPRLRGEVLERQSESHGTLLDMTGMSGGPVFAISPQPTGFHHKLFAVQVAQGVSSDSVYGCFLRPALAWLLNDEFRFDEAYRDDLTPQTIEFDGSDVRAL